jgi:hypothetical protein
LIGVDTWERYVTDADTGMGPMFRIKGARHQDAPVKKMSIPYDIAASNPPTIKTRPTFKFTNIGNPLAEILRKIPKEQVEDTFQKALLAVADDMVEETKKIQHIPTGLLRDAFVYGKASIDMKEIANSLWAGHNHSYQAHSRHDDKWQPNKYSADKRRRIRKQAVNDYAVGGSLAQIARRYGVKRETVTRWVNLAKQGLL